jgi:hypothetical protein
VATGSVGNHLSICLKTRGNQERHGDTKKDTGKPRKTRGNQERHGETKKDTGKPRKTRRNQERHGETKKDAEKPRRVRRYERRTKKWAAKNAKDRCKCEQSTNLGALRSKGRCDSNSRITEQCDRL